MVNIEELEAENRSLREELLRVKREVLEAGVISQELETGNFEKMSVLLFSYMKLDEEALEKMYRDNMKAYNVVKGYLGFPITGVEE